MTLYVLICIFSNPTLLSKRNLGMSSLSAKMLTLTTLLILIHVLECKAKNYCGSNFCKNTKQHILCKFPSYGPAKHCLDFERTIKTEEDRASILDKLNNRRNKVAAGELRSLPASSDMRILEWNTELELFAQRWANQCIQYNSPDLRDSCRDLDDAFVGQNIATIYGDSPGLTAAALVDVWYMELLSINESIISRFKESSESGLNHYEYFSQLVWADSREVGCGSVKFKDRDNGNRTVYRLVCNFFPGGNLEGKPVYSCGAPCSKCPENTACDAVYNALCKTKRETNIENANREKDIFEFETSKGNLVTDLQSTETTTDSQEKDTTDEVFTPYDFSHIHDFTRQLVTATPKKHNCQDVLSVDSFIELLKKKLSGDSDFKELLFSKKSTLGYTDSPFTDPSVAAFVSRLYNKKEFTTAPKATEIDLLNSTLLVDLVEAVIFRSNGGSEKPHIIDEDRTTLASVNVVRVQAELSKIQKNNDFTGHYFFPEDDDGEVTTGETTESYYDASSMEIKDVMMEIEDIKRTTATVDFLDEIFEAEQVTESSTSIIPLSPDGMNIYKSGHNVMKKFLEDITDRTPPPV